MDLQERNSSFRCFGILTGWQKFARAAPRPHPKHRWVKVHHSHDDGKSKPQAVVEEPPLWRSQKITVLLLGCLDRWQLTRKNIKSKCRIDENRPTLQFFWRHSFLNILMDTTGATNFRSLTAFLSSSPARQHVPFHLLPTAHPSHRLPRPPETSAKMQPSVAVVSSFAYLNRDVQ